MQTSASSGPLHTTPDSNALIAAALAKASPLPPSRKLLKRASSIGHDIANHPSLPKRRRITGKSGPRIEFAPPRDKPPPLVPDTSKSSSHATFPLSDTALPEEDPKIVLPEVDVDNTDAQHMYAGYKLYDLKNGFLDRQKVRIWLRAAVMKHHRHEVTAMISAKRKLPVEIRRKAFGAQLQWACQKTIIAMPLSSQKKLVLTMHGDMKGDKHEYARAMLAKWMYRKDYRTTLINSDSTGVLVQFSQFFVDMDR